MKGAKLMLSCLGFCLLALEPGSATGSDNGPSVELTRRAIALGVEPATLGELWRTKQPVIISKPDALGQLYTTTYELTPDDRDIILSSVKEQQPLSTTTVAPRTTSSSTTTSSTTTTSTTTSSTTPSASLVEATHPHSEWEYVPTALDSRPTLSLGSNWPNFGGTWPQLPRSNSWPSFDIPAGVTPQTTTKTEVDDQGRRVTTTTLTYKGPVTSGTWSPGTGLSASWPSFTAPAGHTPQISTTTYQSPIFTSWQPKTTNSFDHSLPQWFKNPQFVRGAADEAPSGTQPVSSGAQPSPSWTQPVPVPVPALRPLALPTRPTLESQPTRPTFDSLPPLPTAASTATVNPDEQPTLTRVTSYSGSFSGPAPPSTAELEPQLRDMLSRAGITDDDLRNARAQGNDLTRTQHTPDGRVITTKVRFNNWSAPAGPTAPTPPTAPAAPTWPTAPTPPTAPAAPTWPTAPAAPAVSQLPQLPPLPHMPRRSDRDFEIDNYLMQVQLRPEDIEAQNGELVKTIVDQNGRVLSVRFVLSSVKGENEHGQGQPQKPTW